MKTLLILLLVTACLFAASPNDGIYLIVRADDIGSSHAANVACIQSYQEGIARSVEVMVPCAWFLEAADMLRNNPGYDVGVHLTFTSEWSNVKWRPITCAPSMVDSNGYFFPKQRNWADENAQDAFANVNPDPAEVEAEIRAQIEMAMQHIPQVSHVSGHMGAPMVNEELSALTKKIVQEYGLEIDLGAMGLKRARWGASSEDDAETREQKLIDMLNGLENGLYLVVEHPGLDVPEMQAHGHSGYEHVASHRDGVTKSFCSDKVKNVIKERGIQLISYKDAQEMFGK